MQTSFPKPQPRPISLDAQTTLGSVQLTVPNLKRALAFYQNVLGLRLGRMEKNAAHLGAGGADLLVLVENPDARTPRFATGLYHFAILVPSRLELARALRNFIQRDLELGFGDHRVSEAIYFSDPDGNGIEVYRDRPRREWYDAHGNFVMGTWQMDVRGLLRELEHETDAWQGLARETVLGHMHLKVADVNRAAAFYRDVIGFDEMANLGSAAFVSAGGYHHHLGMNNWESANAPAPPPDAVGLQYFTLLLPNAAALARVTQRVMDAGGALQETAAGLLVRDPSGNGMVLTTKGIEN